MPALLPTPSPYPSSTLFPSSTLYPGLGGGAPFTAGLLDSCAPWLEHDASGDLNGYLVALGSMLDLVTLIVQSTGTPGDAGYVPGWSTLLDPANCPDALLPYLSQFIGVPLPPGTDPTYARKQVYAECQYRRGQGFGGTYDSTTASLPAPENGGSIIWAIQQNLSGTKSVTLIERRGVSVPDPYHFVVVVRPGELGDITNLTAMVNDRKPGGLQWTLVQTDAWTWNQALGTWNADNMTWNQTATIRP